MRSKEKVNEVRYTSVFWSVRRLVRYRAGEFRECRVQEAWNLFLGHRATLKNSLNNLDNA